MNTFPRLGLHTVYALGLLLMVLFSGSEYDWMTEIGPSIPAGAIEDGSDSRAVVSGLLMAVIVATQMVIAVMTNKKREIWLSGALMLLAFVVWLV